MGVALKEGFADLREGDVRAFHGEDALEIGVGELGEHQIVHFIERVDGEGHIAAPLKIIKNTGHGFSSISVCQGLFCIMPCTPSKHRRLSFRDSSSMDCWRPELYHSVKTARRPESMK